MMKREGVPGHPEVARRVKMARAGAGLSQGELAARVAALLNHPGISRGIISRIESAERDAEGRVLAAIAQATNADYGWINEPLRAAVEIRDPIADNALYRGSYEPYEDLHPVNAGVKDGGWFARDDEMHLPNPSWWEGLQAETLPIKIAS